MERFFSGLGVGGRRCRFGDLPSALVRSGKAGPSGGEPSRGAGFCEPQIPSEVTCPIRVIRGCFSVFAEAADWSRQNTPQKAETAVLPGKRPLGSGWPTPAGGCQRSGKGGQISGRACRRPGSGWPMPGRGGQTSGNDGQTSGDGCPASGSHRPTSAGNCQTDPLFSWKHPAWADSAPTARSPPWGGNALAPTERRNLPTCT